MKKGLLVVLTMVLFFTLTSLAYSSEKALTTENISGIWNGYFAVTLRGEGKAIGTCKILITPSLTGVVSCSSDKFGKWKDVLDGQGEIINNQLVIRDRKNPDIIRLKAYMKSNKVVEGDYNHLYGTPRDYKGDLLKFKKIRDLNDEEKQWPLSQLQGLLK